MTETTYIPAFVLEPPKPGAADASARKASARGSTPSFIEDVAAGRVQLPTIPRVVQGVLKALRQPEVDFRKVGQAMALDPVLTAKVLKVANSAAFGARRTMSSIDAAIGLIGVKGLNKVIMTCGVAAALDGTPGIDLQRFWREALIAAIAAQKLAAVLDADPEEAYTCGLLHATGHLILCRSYPDVADAMFTGFEVVRGEELAAIERDAFGIDHPVVGAMWAQALGFPPSVTKTIAHLVKPLAEPTPPIELALRGACSLVASVATNASTEAALAALAPPLRERWTGADGQPDDVFTPFYEALQQTETVG